MLFSRVKKLSEERGENLKTVATKLGFSENAFYKWKTQSPKSETLNKVADYFKVSTDYLLGRTAFKKPMELFEHWSGHNNPYFESPFDFGGLLKEVREEQGVSQQEVSKALDITESDVDDIENGTLPLNYDWAEKYANFLGTSVEQIFINNNMSVSLNDIPSELLHHYREQGMSETEMVIAYARFREAEFKDAMSESKNTENSPNYKPETIAAHHDGEEWTEEELKQIEEFKEFVRSRRKQKGE